MDKSGVALVLIGPGSIDQVYPWKGILNCWYLLKIISLIDDLSMQW